MDFTNQILDFSERVKQLKNQVSTEEATKMSLIAPFFQLLGYDIFNPLEFCPEYTADVGIKRGEKVDYAIIMNGQPVILIEAKAVNKKLEKQDSQLFRYFSTTSARFAILTNGIIYKFYTDLSEKNKMDREPFYEFNILNISEDNIKEIFKFTKDNFNEEQAFNDASILKYANLFKFELQKQFKSPSDDFVRFFLKDYYKGTKTQNVIEKFRPVLKHSMDDYIDDITKSRITSMVNDSGYSNMPTSPDSDKSDVSDNELDIIMLFKTFLSDVVDMEDITYKKTESYIAILYKGNVRKWIARFILNSPQITLIIPDSNKTEMRYKVETANDILNFSDVIKKVLTNYLSPSKPQQFIFTKWGKYIKPDPYKVNLSRNYP